MKTIIFHGVLADKFGKKYRLAVHSAREATHAIACQLPEFKKFMLNAENQGMRFAVFVGNELNRNTNIGERELDNLTDKDTIHIVPKIMGSGGDAMGWLQVVAGAVMVGVGFLASGITAGASTALISAGIGLMVGGASTLLMPTPELENADEDGNRSNYGFGGAVTTVAQGNPVPVLYGRRQIGGFIVSAGQYTEDQA